MRVYVQSPPSIQVGGRQTRAQYQFTLPAPTRRSCTAYAPLLEAKMRAHPILVDVNTDLLLKNPQINVDIDRDKAASLGVTAQQIEDTLYTAYGTRQISTIFAPNNAYQVDHGAEARVPDRHHGPLAPLRALVDRASSCRSTRWSG